MKEEGPKENYVLIGHSEQVYLVLFDEESPNTCTLQPVEADKPVIKLVRQLKGVPVFHL